MNEYDLHENLLKQVCKEIALINDQIQKNGTMTEKDLERLDKLYHIKKSMLACWGMEHPEEYEMSGGMSGYSGYRGRGANGRFVSRDSSGRFEEGYNSGYEQGYSRAMSQAQGGGNGGGGNSGHYPRPYPYPERNW